MKGNLICRSLYYLSQRNKFTVRGKQKDEEARAVRDIDKFQPDGDPQ